MSSACPIDRRTVDERAARLSALLVLVILSLALSLGSAWIAFLLALDFGLRALGASRLSPCARASQALLKLARVGSRPTNAGPKIFAARLGLAFSLAVTLALLFSNRVAAFGVGVPFGLCAILEGVFGLCVGCRIYQAMHSLRASRVCQADKAG